MQEIDLEEIKRLYPTYKSANGHLIASHIDEDYAETFISYSPKNGISEIHKVLTPSWVIKWFRICGVSITNRKEKGKNRLYIYFGNEKDLNSALMITSICSKCNPYKDVTKDYTYDFRNIITEFNPTSTFINKYREYITEFDYKRGK